MKIIKAKSEEDILKCWDVMKALRPHLRQEEFLPMVSEMIREGYVLAFIEEGGKAVAAAGYRYLQFLFNGKHLYIDDLSTLPEARRKGYAGKLLDYVFEEARAMGFSSVTLDSGYQRVEAHRLYLNKGFVLASHHFQKRI